jgi:hypothetical protein
MGNSSKNGWFSIAPVDHQRVYLHVIHCKTSCTLSLVSCKSFCTACSPRVPPKKKRGARAAKSLLSWRWNSLQFPEKVGYILEDFSLESPSKTVASLSFLSFPSLGHLKISKDIIQRSKSLQILQTCPVNPQPLRSSSQPDMSRAVQVKSVFLFLKPWPSMAY